jgi:hypothetical protein
MSKSIFPLMMRWDGEAMIPINASAADRQYVIGKTYNMEPREERSGASHNHYFASVHEAFLNLPEHLARKIPTEEHLRKYALIKAGYRDEKTVVYETEEDAKKTAALIRPFDEYAIVQVDGFTVTVYTAQSQKMNAMGKKKFQESKEKVLDVIANMIDVSTKDLKQNAGQAA